MQFRHRGNAGKPILNNNEDVIPLINLKEGECGIVAHAFGGFGLIRRLSDMGLTPGVEVKLLRKCPFRGPLEVEIRGVALALGYGVASKVLVRPLKAQANG